MEHKKKEEQRSFCLFVTLVEGCVCVVCGRRKKKNAVAQTELLFSDCDGLVRSREERGVGYMSMPI